MSKSPGSPENQNRRVNPPSLYSDDTFDIEHSFSSEPDRNTNGDESRDRTYLSPSLKEAATDLDSDHSISSSTDGYDRNPHQEEEPRERAVSPRNEEDCLKQQEASVAATATAASIPQVEAEDEELAIPRFLGSLQDAEHVIPGAYAMPGDYGYESTSLPSSSNSSPEPVSVPVASTQAVVASIDAPLSAELVDVAAEERRRLEFEQGQQELKLERQRNRELQDQIDQIASSAVVAIPVQVEDTTPEDTTPEVPQEPPPTSSPEPTDDSSCFQNKQTRRRLQVGILSVVVVGAIVGIVLGVLFRPKDQEPNKWDQVGQTLPGNGAKDYFGYSVALSANGMAVAGSGFGDNGRGSLAGYVRVFYANNNSDGGWAKLGQDIHGKTKGDEFGTIVTLSRDGRVMAAGALSDRDGIGYIQVHALNSDNTWEQMGQDIKGRVTGDEFGSAVSLCANGNVIAAGGPGREYNSVDYNGNQTGYVKVFAFDKNGSDWKQMGRDLNGSMVGDAFGRSVALSANGTVVAVGADWSDANGPVDAGRVQVFAYNDTIDDWQQMGQDLVGEGTEDYFGFALDLSEDGTIVAVGGVWNHGSNGFRSGHVRVFSYDSVNNRWNQMGQDIDGESSLDQYGVSVALSADGMTVAAGANKNNGAGGEFSGHVRVFRYDSDANRWGQHGEDLDGEGKYDEFGLSVSLSSDGTIVAGGSQYNNGNGPSSGHVRVFQTSNG